MESHLTLFGHPLHAMLVVFPIGLFFTSFLFDWIFLWKRDPFWLRAAFWLIAVGEAGALAAVATGLVDYFAIPMPERAREEATAHLYVGLGVAALYGLQLWLRRRHAGPSPPVRLRRSLLVLAPVSALAVLAQGWIGGQLSHVHGVGVVPERARPDAPPPVVPGQPVEVSGAAVYRRFCAGCHGRAGEGGTGPALAGTTHPHTLEEIAEVVREGEPPRMPAFGDQLSPEEIEAVSRYVLGLMERE